MATDASKKVPSAANLRHKNYKNTPLSTVVIILVDVTDTTVVYTPQIHYIDTTVVYKTVVYVMDTTAARWRHTVMQSARFIEHLMQCLERLGDVHPRRLLLNC